MLPPAHRLRRSADFSSTVRAGRRAGRRTLVAYLNVDPSGDGAGEGAASPVRVGFVVSKAVGGSVVRNRVARRLRHQMSTRLAGLPSESQLVIRALPPAATASSAELSRDLDRALERLR